MYRIDFYVYNPLDYSNIFPRNSFIDLNSFDQVSRELLNLAWSEPPLTVRHGRQTGDRLLSCCHAPRHHSLLPLPHLHHQQPPPSPLQSDRVSARQSDLKDLLNSFL